MRGGPRWFYYNQSKGLNRGTVVRGPIQSDVVIGLESRAKVS